MIKNETIRKMDVIVTLCVDDGEVTICGIIPHNERDKEVLRSILTDNFDIDDEEDEKRLADAARDLSKDSFARYYDYKIYIETKKYYGTL